VLAVDFAEVIMATLINSANAIAEEVNADRTNFTAISQHLQILRDAADAAMSMNDLGLTAIDEDAIADLITKLKLNSNFYNHDSFDSETI